MILLSSWLAYEISSIVLHRYEQDATALFYETNYRSWELEAPSVTICSSCVSNSSMEEVLQSLVNVKPEDTQYQQYYNFIHSTITIDYSRLDKFLEYKNMTTHISPTYYSRLALNVRQNILLWQGYQGFDFVFTEMAGICLSTFPSYRKQ